MKRGNIVYRIGVDLGGTNIKVGLVGEDYRIIDQRSCKTNVQTGAEGVTDRIVSQVRGIMKQNSITEKDIPGVGVGCPGIINTESGTVIYSNNFDWHNLPVKAILEKKLGMPIAVTNDANCAVLGELWAGNGAGCRNIVLLTLGTGVGSGIIVNGELLTGSGCGGVAGHNIIIKDGRRCTCGKNGCLEAYASATALISETKKKLTMNPYSRIADLCRRNPDRIDGKTAFEAARLGDACGAEIVDEYIDALATGISNLVNLFRPEKILLSGGICNQGERLLTPLNEKVKKYCFAAEYLHSPVVEIARLKNTAGIIGAASSITQKGEI